jgi:hypothetical protein
MPTEKTRFDKAKPENKYGAATNQKLQQWQGLKDQGFWASRNVPATQDTAMLRDLAYTQTQYDQKTPGEKAKGFAIDAAMAVAPEIAGAAIPALVKGAKAAMSARQLARAGEYTPGVKEGLKDAMNTFRFPIGKKATKALYREQIAARDKGTQFLEDWYSDPIIQKRLGAVDSELVSELDKSATMVKKHTKSGKVPQYDRDYIRKHEISGVYTSAPTEANKYRGTAYSLSNYGKGPLSFTPKDVESTTIHEGAHKVYQALTESDYMQMMSMGQGPKATERIGELPYYKYKQQLAANIEHQPKSLTWTQKEFNYFTDPTEINSRNMEIRKALGKKPSDVITQEEILKLKKKGGPGTDMFKYIKPNKGYVDFLNNSFSIASVVGLGKAATSKKPEEYKMGGKVEGDPTKKLDYTGMGIGFVKNPPSNYITEEEYYNPKVEKGITSGDRKLDLLYKNQWLMKLPYVKDKIKDKAEDVARNSGGSSMVMDMDIDKKQTKDKVSPEYTGTNYGYKSPEGVKQTKMDLVGHYFHPEKSGLEKASYKPSSDYLTFLPTYSIKKDFKNYSKEIQNKMMSEFISSVHDGDGWLHGEKITPEEEVKKQGEFEKTRKPIYQAVSKSSLERNLQVNLAGHKIGMAWDEEVGLPYVSLSDAWDFEPKAYTNKWTSAGYKQEGFMTAEEEKSRQKTKIQSTLMQKAGSPFKIYDRFYYDPKTKEYIPDDKIQKMKGNRNFGKESIAYKK